MLAKLSKLSVREKIGVAAAILTLFSLAVDKTVVVPAFSRMAELNSLIGEEEREFRMGLAVLGTQDAVTAEYEQVKRLIELPMSPERISQDTQVEILDVASKSGIALEETPAAAGVIKLGQCEEYLLEVKKVNTDMIHLLNFISDLRGSKGLYRVVKMDIQPGSTENSVMVVSMVVGRTVLRTGDMAAPRKEE